MSGFKPYPAYKDSGVEWLGEVPGDWEMMPSKRLFPESKERAPESDEQLSATQDYGVIAQAEFMRLAGRRVVQLNQNLGLRKRVEIDDFVISMRSFQGGLERAWAAGGIRSSYVVLRPVSSLVLGYYQRLFKSINYIQALQSTTNFVRDGQDMSYQNFVLIDLPLPPVHDQTQIARFLDHETARIDALIEEQQRLIELLKEKRQAVISHAVTKGLDPTVPMKDSGVEWLGEVPAHWDSLTLGRVASSVKTGGTPSVDLPSADIIDGVEWYTPGDFTGDLLLDNSEKRVSAGAVRSGDAKVFPSGSVLIVSIGATLGKVGHIRRPASANQQINAIVPGPRVDGYFLAYSLSVKVNAMRFLSNASTIGIMNQEKTKEIWLSLPPLQDQKLITKFLDKQNSVIDTLIQEAAGGVALLQERRSALISAAVTGKIDVRGWQPPASTQAPESAVAEVV